MSNYQLSINNYQLPEGYKQTEVGVIPEDWQPRRVGELVTFSGGSQPPRSTFVFKPRNDYVRLIQIRDYKTDAYATYIPGNLVKKSCTEDDVMIGRYGPPIFQILRGLEGAYNVALIKAIPSDEIDRDFFYHFIRNDELFKLMEMLSQRSSGQTGVELPALREYPLALPPKEEQRSIATALSDVDTLIAALDKLIAKKRHLKTATMQQLLTGKKRLPGFGGEWELKQVSELGVTYGGLTGKRKADFGIGASRYITFLNVINNVQIDTDDLERVNVCESENQNNARKGDLLFNTSSETPEEVGMCSVMNKDVDEVYLNSFCFGFRLLDPSNVFSLYLAYFFRSDEGRKHLYSLAQGATRYNLSKTNFLKLLIKLPSVEEQRAIATVLSDMDSEIAAIEARRAKTQAIKQGMMQQLLTGKVRLVASA
jgi:type I restriction enzyme S subunit